MAEHVVIIGAARVDIGNLRITGELNPWPFGVLLLREPDEVLAAWAACINDGS